jgi:hypothetical protein
MKHALFVLIVACPGAVALSAGAQLDRAAQSFASDQAYDRRCDG